MRTETNLTALPTWKYNEPGPAVEGEPLRWSGKTPPPAIGDKVRVSEWLGGGLLTVDSYFCERGYLGLHGNLDTMPKWLKDQRRAEKRRGSDVHLFGVDLA